MCGKKGFRWKIFVLSMIFVVHLAGCGGDDDSSLMNPTDYSLGEGAIQANWTFESGQIVHDRSRNALYRVSNREIIAVDLENGAQNSLVSLSFDPAGLRLTTDDTSLYILETKESANADNGRPDLVRYDIDLDRIGTEKIEIKVGVSVVDFLATTNDRVVIAGCVPPEEDGEQNLYLYNITGDLLHDVSVYGFWPRLTLKWDQQTLFYEVTASRSVTLQVISMESDKFVELSDAPRHLAFGALNTYEPDGDRLFRSCGEVLFGEEDSVAQIPWYNAIDFDPNNNLFVLLIRQGDHYFVGYYDLDTLVVLNEQDLPGIEGLEGFRPTEIFIGTGSLYLVYEDVVTGESGETISGENRNLVKYRYPH